MLAPVFLSALSVLSLWVSNVYAQCGKSCKFRLCTPDVVRRNPLPRGSKVVLRAPKVAGYPFICRPGTDLGKVMRTGEALVSGPGRSQIRVSRWRPPGLSGKLSKRYFKLGSIPLSKKAQGVSRREGKGFTQLGGLCVELPILKYQVFTSRGRKARTMTGGSGDCLAFTAISPRLVAEITWGSSEDLDILMTGPLNGFRFSGDVESDCLGGQETAVVQNPVSGVYGVKWGHHHDHDDGEFTFKDRWVNSVEAVARWHPNYRFCKPRNVKLSGTAVPAAGRVKGNKRSTRKFPLIVTVAFDGEVIVQKSSTAVVGGHGLLGMISIKCSGAGAGLSCVEN